MATARTREAILSVTEINRRVRMTLETDFPAVWVRGELTELRPIGSSGHRYFSLKDDRSLLECVILQREASRLRFDLRNGLAVEAFGRISVYEPRGRYQLVIDALRPAGLGERLLALEELKRRLQAEGLFDEARKRPLPRYPARVGLVTSPVTRLPPATGTRCCPTSTTTAPGLIHSAVTASARPIAAISRSA